MPPCLRPVQRLPPSATLSFSEATASNWNRAPDDRRGSTDGLDITSTSADRGSLQYTPP